MRCKQEVRGESGGERTCGVESHPGDGEGEGGQGDVMVDIRGALAVRVGLLEEPHLKARSVLLCLHCMEGHISWSLMVQQLRSTIPCGLAETQSGMPSWHRQCCTLAGGRLD